MNIWRMNRSNLRGVVVENGSNKRDDDGNCNHHHRHHHHDGGVGEPTIKIKVSHGSNHYNLAVPSHFTFGDLKRVIAQETGLDPKEQKLLFRGTEKEDQEYLQMAGVKDNAKVLLMEDKAIKERKVEVVKESTDLSRGHEGVAEVRSEVDKLLSQVAALETAVNSGTRVADKEFIVLSELLMRQLLKLDGIEAEGEGRVQRRNEVRRVQSLVDTVDALKTRNANPCGNSSKAVSVTTKWETFDSGVGSLGPPPPTCDSGVGSLGPPPPTQQSSTEVTQDWEVFD